MRITRSAAAPRKKKPKRQETSLSKAIQDSLALKGARVIRIQSGQLQVVNGARRYFVHLAPKGTPDLLVIVPRTRLSSLVEARHVWLEVKDVRGKQSAEQTKWGEWAGLEGVRHAVVRSVSEAIAAVFGSEQRRVG